MLTPDREPWRLAKGRAFAHIAKFHPELTAFRRDLHAHPELGFEERYTAAQSIVSRDLEQSMGSEDFSFMLQAKPGAYLRLGQGVENGVGGCFLHNSRYDFNDDVLPLGSALHASLVEQAMPFQGKPS